MLGRILDWSMVNLASGDDFVSHFALQGLGFLKMGALECVISKYSIGDCILASSKEGGDQPRGSWAPFHLEFMNGILSLSRRYISSLLPSLFLSGMFPFSLFFMGSFSSATYPHPFPILTFHISRVQVEGGGLAVC